MAVRRPAPPAAEADARQAYLRAISTFPRLTVEEKREVMRLRYGLDGEEPKTLQEIGDRLHLSRERIRQIESRAKEKLRSDFCLPTCVFWILSSGFCL